MGESISAQMVMQLRKRTGVGMSKCKEALVSTNGDMEEAIIFLRKKGMASAVKKESREAKEGMVVFAEDANNVVLLEVNAETDYVVQNAKFQAFTKNLVEEALLAKPASVESFLSGKYSKNPTLTVDEYRSDEVLSMGENIQVRRLELLEKKEGESIGVYSHMGGKIVTLVCLKGSSDKVNAAKDVAMHVAAESPDYLKADEIASEIKAKEEEVARSQLQGKPANIMDKIITGKMRAFYEQVCLENQKFVKESSMTVKQFVEQTAGLSIAYFRRWQVGQ
ncbi:elongation factor Ts [Candidatus Aerophobetes bacterium]|uniref:Elongation factor Ts n=1 Tax=Aerophobetes bacterium TaxID=2030807 RepID=A0A2A4X696_UNCAE|nr:MAG: elongation factor Ts [Candidatus Aerophobetes bacterium]